MSNLKVEVITPGGVALKDTLIPQDYTVRQVVQDLVEALQLPYWSETHGDVKYDLLWGDANLRLDPSMSLVDLGVMDGHSIRLVSSAKVVEPTAPVLPTEPTNDSTVLVRIDLYGGGSASCEETLDADVPVRELIGYLRKRHQLPEYERENPITYKMSSKFLARTLHHDETLRRAKVPPLDTLVLLKEWIAG